MHRPTQPGDHPSFVRRQGKQGGLGGVQERRQRRKGIFILGMSIETRYQDTRHPVVFQGLLHLHQQGNQRPSGTAFRGHQPDQFGKPYLSDCMMQPDATAFEVQYGGTHSGHLRVSSQP